MYAAEEAARFLHHACRGLPRYGNAAIARELDRSDEFCECVMEHALAYFGSRVLHPARPALSEESEQREISRSVFTQRLKSALRSDFATAAEDLGYRLGAEMYADYLAGSLSRGAVRRLLLSHSEEAGVARKICLKIAGADRSRRKKLPASSALMSQHRQVL
jgi:hypothetical protein